MHRNLDFWWPDAPIEDGIHQAYLNSVNDMTLAMQHVKKFDIAVQAGGHCGEWAKWLAKRFQAVYTFEPDRFNFQCLTRNIEGSEIFAAHGFLGAERGPIALCREQYSLGGSHHGVKDVGLIPVYLIDDLSLPACDAIILDVEGMEYSALLGAMRTIKRFSPVIQIENFERYAERGWGNYEQIRALLEGYEEVGRINYDIVLVKP